MIGKKLKNEFYETSSYDGKRPEQIESQTHFSKRRTEMCKMTKTIFGKVRKALGNMSALTSEKGLVFREVRAGQVNSDKSSSI